MECVKACEFLRHYGTYPKRYVRDIYNNVSIVMGLRKANRMIDSCTLCGLCDTLCPNDLAMGEVCLEARRDMVDSGHMPASHHDFALRDMAHSRSEAAAFARRQPGRAECAVAFFPGCQLVGVVALARRARLRPSRREDPRRRRPDGRLLRRAGAVERPPRAARGGRREPARDLAQPRRACRSSPPARPA